MIDKSSLEALFLDQFLLFILLQEKSISNNFSKKMY